MRTLLFPLKSHTHVRLELLSILFLVGFLLGHSFFLLIHIVVDDFHCSLTLLLLRLRFIFPLISKLSGKFGRTVAFLSLELVSILLLLGLRI